MIKTTTALLRRCIPAQPVIFLFLIFFGYNISGAYAQCHAKFTYTIHGDTLTVHDTSTAAHGCRVYWIYGDGSYSSYYHSYASNTYIYTDSVSTYKLCERIEDTINHCTADTCITIRVHHNHCTASFSMDIDWSNKKITFNNQSYTPHHFKSHWDFGDSTTSDSTNPTHTYPKGDTTFTICLTITDSVRNCTTTFCQTVRVNEFRCNPMFHFLPDSKHVDFYDDSYSAFSHTCSWDFGDGHHATGNHTDHTYDKDSAYRVCLTIVDKKANCSSTFCATVDLNATFNISGSVYPDTNIVCRKGKVWLIKYDPTDSSLKAVKDTTIDTIITGRSLYFFKHIKTGIYYTKAAFDSTNPLDTMYIPTYCYDATRWSKASRIELTQDISRADIMLKKGSHHGGKGFISGKISAGANKVGDAVPHQEVILYDPYYNPVAYTYSDNNGAYQFRNMAMGTYIVYVEVLGVVSQPSYVTLSDKNQIINNVNFTVSTTQVRALSGIANVESPTEKANVYPNPVRNDLMINISSAHAQDALVLVYDINGRLVSQNNMQVVPGDQVLHLNVTAFKNGMYFIKIQLSHDNYIIQSPFVKSE